MKRPHEQILRTRSVVDGIGLFVAFFLLFAANDDERLAFAFVSPPEWNVASAELYSESRESERSEETRRILILRRLAMFN